MKKATTIILGTLFVFSSVIAETAPKGKIVTVEWCNSEHDRLINDKEKMIKTMLRKSTILTESLARRIVENEILEREKLCPEAVSKKMTRKEFQKLIDERYGDIVAKAMLQDSLDI